MTDISGLVIASFLLIIWGLAVVDRNALRAWVQKRKG